MATPRDTTPKTTSTTNNPTRKPRKRKPPSPNPRGQPSSIDQTVGTRTDGTPITAFDRIIHAISIGSYFEQACAAAGIHKDTAYAWLTTGARTHAARARAIDKALPAPKETKHEQRCAQFSDAILRAEAEWELSSLATLETLARGGTQIETVTVKTDGANRVVDRTVKTETLLPSAQVIEWRLSRRFPARYSHHVEVTGADQGPIAVMQTTSVDVGALHETLDAIVAAHADTDVTSGQ